jgi:hypothetical protein
MTDELTPKVTIPDGAIILDRALFGGVLYILFLIPIPREDKTT